jgi:hypothetical protein
MSKIKIFLFVGSAAIFALVLSNLMKPDTLIEEVTEVALERHTGVDVDLSPGKGDKY